MTTRTQLFAQLLNPTGELSQAFPAGSNAAPSIFTTGDLNTGIFFPAADNIGFATNGVIRGRWTTDGLCFGSDTAAANALDDYEEGTWTPTGNGITYTSVAGLYTKIGRVVVANFEVSFPSTASGSAAQILGLPFTVNAVSNNASTGITNYGDSNIVAYCAANDTIIRFRNYSNTDLTNANLSSKFFFGVVIYHV